MMYNNDYMWKINLEFSIKKSMKNGDAFLVREKKKKSSFVLVDLRNVHNLQVESYVLFGGKF